MCSSCLSTPSSPGVSWSVGLPDLVLLIRFSLSGRTKRPLAAPVIERPHLYRKDCHMLHYTVPRGLRIAHATLCTQNLLRSAFFFFALEYNSKRQSMLLYYLLAPALPSLRTQILMLKRELGCEFRGVQVSPTRKPKKKGKVFVCSAWNRSENERGVSLGKNKSVVVEKCGRSRDTVRGLTLTPDLILSWPFFSDIEV